MIAVIQRVTRASVTIAATVRGEIRHGLLVLLGIGHPGTGTRIHPTNTGLTDWEWEPSPGRWTLHSFNEATHLLRAAAE